jgi:hypothetical protein
MLENRMLRRILGPKRKYVETEKLSTEELHRVNFCKTHDCWDDKIKDNEMGRG